MNAQIQAVWPNAFLWLMLKIPANLARSQCYLHLALGMYFCTLHTISLLIKKINKSKNQFDCEWGGEGEREKATAINCSQKRVHVCIMMKPHTTPTQKLLDAQVPRLPSLIWLKTAGGQNEDYRESREQHAGCVHTLISGGSHSIVFHTLCSDSPSVTTAKRCIASGFSDSPAIQ